VRAACCRELGPPEGVVVEDVPDPVPGAGEVLIDVVAAAVNFPDVLLVAGEYQVRIEPPFVPGSELAGTVAEVGEGVDGVAVGDRVFGTAIQGAFAERAVLPATSLTRTPDGVDDAAAAAFGVAHRTAFHSLRSVARVQPGDEVLVLGASGGVGLAAVELAAQMGATVTAVASSAERLAVAASKGAAHLVDRTGLEGSGGLRPALRALRPDGVDVVIDPVGGDLAEPALRSLRWGGRFVTVGYAAGSIPRIPLNLVLLKGIQILGFEFLGFVTHRPDEASANDAELLGWLADGRVRPHVGARFALADAAAALRAVADGTVVGKAVLDVRPPAGSAPENAVLAH
jgi:NADPH2:quinone reductase